jgi:hypothetical protein
MYCVEKLIDDIIARQLKTKSNSHVSPCISPVALVLAL